MIADTRYILTSMTYAIVIWLCAVIVDIGGVSWERLICLYSHIVIFFFFSSRRRHTRLQGDWSSDVCSSDLHDVQERVELAAALGEVIPDHPDVAQHVHEHQADRDRVGPGEEHVLGAPDQDRKSVV